MEQNLIQTLKNYNSKIEESIIYCLLTRPSLFEEIMITEKYFISHKNIFKLIRNVYLKYKTADIVLITSEYSSVPALIDILADILTNCDPYLYDFHSYEEAQVENYKKYLIEKNASLLLDKQLSINEFTESITEINLENITLDIRKSEDDIYDLISSKSNEIIFDKMKKLGQKVQFLKNTFNVIAARPATGKSAFALNMIEDLSKNYRCIYFNMEMTEKEMYERLVAINTKIPIKYFSQQSKNQKNVIVDSIHELLSRNLKIINGSKSIQAMKSLIIKEQQKGHTLVFIDYIGYVIGSKNKNDRERIGEVVRELQVLSKDYDITIFCVAQLNRDGTDEPTKENLKDSGELEQTGHAIIIIHNASGDPLNDQTPNMKIIIAKNRSSSPGYFTMKYTKETQIFSDEEVKSIEKYTAAS